MVHTEIKIATINDLNDLLPLVRQYHKFEGIELAEKSRRVVVNDLVKTPELGRIWIMFREDRIIGYVAICFGYSIEFGGRDGFVDELFITDKYRGKGYGRSLINVATKQMVALGIKALHLEVARTNGRAKDLYTSLGFKSRENFHLMTVRYEHIF